MPEEPANLNYRFKLHRNIQQTFMSRTEKVLKKIGGETIDTQETLFHPFQVRNLLKQVPRTLQSIEFGEKSIESSNSMSEFLRTQKKMLKAPQNVTELCSPTEQEKRLDFDIKLKELYKTDSTNLKKSKGKASKNALGSPTTTQHFNKKSSKIRQNLQNHRINNICKNVIKKLRRNNVNSMPIREQQISQFQVQEGIYGIVLSDLFSSIWEIFGSVIFISIYFFLTFALVFPEVKNGNCQLILMVLGLLFFLGEMVINTIVIRRENGRQIVEIKQIAKFYLHGYFFIDLIIIALLILVLTQAFNNSEILLLGLLSFKLRIILQKLKKIEKLIVKSYYYEKYWALAKIMLFNFAFAHFIGIVLNLMTDMNPNHNWQVVKQIYNSPWYERYVWSYYWATTIMLTVGFGDIVPTTYQEAIWVIFIEIISCIAFSYNISCLGGLIGSIRSQGLEIDKNRMIFETMAKKVKFSQELTQKVENYIEESVKLRNKFNISEQKDFINNLPSGYRREVLRQSNTNMLKQLTFFNQLLQKSIYRLSQKIERHLYHPEQFIREMSSPLNIYILRDGEIGLTCKKERKCNSTNVPVNLIKIHEKENPLVMTLEFISRKVPNYEIRSLCYSIVFQLSQQSFLQALKSVPKDYEYFSFLKDKSKHIIDEYETIQCKYCHSNHTYFDCPKYHYIPIVEHVIHRELFKQKNYKNTRKQIGKRNHFRRQSALKIKPLSQEAFQLIQEDKQAIGLYKYCLGSDQTYFKNIGDIKTNLFSLSNNENLINQLNDLIKTAVDNELRMKDSYDEVWVVGSDKAWDYDMYFPKDNSSNLSRGKVEHLAQKKTSLLTTLDIRQRINNY